MEALVVDIYVRIDKKHVWRENVNFNLNTGSINGRDKSVIRAWIYDPTLHSAEVNHKKEDI